MSDLVQRLRIFGCEPDTGSAYHEAADALEAKDKEIADIRETLKDHGEIQSALCLEIAKYKALCDQIGAALEAMAAYASESKCGLKIADDALAAWREMK